MIIDLALRKELWERYAYDNASLTPIAVDKLRKIRALIINGQLIKIENSDGKYLEINNDLDFGIWLNNEYDEHLSKTIIA